MSHIGKKGIQIPDKVDVKLNGNVLNVKGPLGELARLIQDDVEVKIAEKIVSVFLRKGAPQQSGLGNIRFPYKQYDKGRYSRF